MTDSIPTIAAPPAAIVPNGTNVPPKIVDTLVADYLSFAKKSAENILKLAETLLRAKDLPIRELNEFCSKVGLERDGSTFKKLIKIGQKYSRFEPFIGQMPNSWTTVYRLAALEDELFDHVSHNVLFSPTMTASDIDRIISNQNLKSSKQLKRDWIIDLSKLEHGQALQVSRKLVELVHEFRFGYKVRRELANEIKLNLIAFSKAA